MAPKSIPGVPEFWPLVGIFLLIIIAGLIAALYFTNMLDLQWMTTLENLINESLSLVFIWATITYTMAPTDEVEELARQIHQKLTNLATREADSDTAPPQETTT